MRFRWKTEKGLTLLEILLASLIFTFGVGATATAYGFIQTSLNKGLALNEAIGLSVGEIESLLSADFTDSALSPTGNPHAVTLPATSFIVTRFNGTMSYSVTEKDWGVIQPAPADDYKEIVMTVSWNDGTARTLNVTALRRKP